MSGIYVSVGRPAREGELHPRYDQESDILTVTSDVSRDWSWGVDIDGKIVFDLDAARVLANFDLHVARRLWEKGPTQHWPTGAPAGVLVFSSDAVKRKSFNLPLTLRYDKEQAVLRIQLGTLQGSEMVALSSDCIALLSAQQLVGFLVRGFEPHAP